MIKDAIQRGLISLDPETVKPEGSTRRTSTGKLVSKSSSSLPDGEGKILPHYLRASTSSCHDFCKYGRKHAFEKKGKHLVLPALSHSKATGKEEDPVKSFNAERRKKLAVKPRATSNSKVKLPGKIKILVQKVPPAAEGIESFEDNDDTEQRHTKIPVQKVSPAAEAIESVKDSDDFEQRPPSTEATESVEDNDDFLQRSPSLSSFEELDTALRIDASGAEEIDSVAGDGTINQIEKVELSDVPENQNFPPVKMVELSDALEAIKCDQEQLSPANKNDPSNQLKTINLETSHVGKNLNIGSAADKPEIIKRNTPPVRRTGSSAKPNIKQENFSSVKRTVSSSKTKASMQKTSPTGKSDFSISKASPVRKSDAYAKPATVVKSTVLARKATEPTAKSAAPIAKSRTPALKSATPVVKSTAPEMMSQSLSNPPRLGAGNSNAKSKLSKSIDLSNVEGKKVFRGPGALSHKPIANHGSNLKPKDTKVTKSQSSINNQKKVGKVESSNEKIKEKTPHVIEQKAEKANSEIVQPRSRSYQSHTSSMPPSSSSLSPSSSVSLSYHGEEEELEYSDSASYSDESYSVSDDGTEGDQVGLLKDDEGKKHMPRRSVAAHPQEKDSEAHKLKFRRGRVVNLQSENNGPRRLRFRPARVLGENENGTAEVQRRSFRKKKEMVGKDPNDPNETVVLRHQDVEGKKDTRGLFNHVIEETASKLVETRKSKVKALVGAFETVISLQESKPASTV